MTDKANDEISRFFIGSSAAANQVRDTISKIAQTDYPVLVVGETGTGKDIPLSSFIATANARTGHLWR